MRNTQGVARHHESEIDRPSRPLQTEEDVIKRCGRMRTLDDLIRLRAGDAVQEPILAYPKSSKDGNAGYEYFTGEDLDCMVDEGVCMLLEMGIQPPPQDGAVVALLTLSDLNMVVAFFALIRLGYTVMMLSPRLHAQACISLLETTHCSEVLYGNTPSILSTADALQQQKRLTTHPIPQRPSPSKTSNGLKVLTLHQTRNRETQRERIAVIAHSSGSTGLPKPVFLNHKGITTHPARGPGLTSFNTLPWYHMHGLTTALQAMYQRKTAFMWDASVPLTTPAVVAALKTAQPESVHGVPYLLQLLVDSPDGLGLLRSAELVTYGGAPCPDDLGDRLVSEGVHFGGYFGLTEAGLVAESVSRPPDSDPYWNYLGFFPTVRPYLHMKPLGNDLYECVYLQGYPPLTASNSDDPPGSYHSKDVFTPHPSIPNRWKYVSRLDDRVTLMNGEKVLPLPIEGTIKQNPLIEDAVVVGVDRAVPGLLLFRGAGGEELSEEDFLDNVWASIDQANSKSEQFAQITSDMVVVLEAGSVRPQTDKKSTIRAQTYDRYSHVIDSLYDGSELSSSGSLQVDRHETESELMKLCAEELKLAIPDTEAEFFMSGMDSLKAIHLRRLILRDFRIPDHKAFGQNVVFETGSVAALAARIDAAQNGEQAEEQDHVAAMQELITKYSTFRSHGLEGSGSKYASYRPRSPSEMRSGNAVILTGATGSIGAHTLHRLLNDDSVSTVYCLTRRDNPLDSILTTLSEKALPVTPEQTSKITALRAPLHEFDMGIDPSTIEEMKQRVSLIIHTAWPVNFNLPLQNFTPHIAGLSNLIDFSMSVYQDSPAVMLFCSSVSTAFGSNEPQITEAPLDLSSSLKMGYAQSKLVGEKIVSHARRSGARAFSLRIGQVSGHSEKGLWNDSEAIPLMVRSALTLKALPELDMDCAWFPADKMAASLLEIAGACSLVEDKGEDDSVYNLVNPHTFTWSSLLSALSDNGFDFETVPFNSWLEKLHESEIRGEEVVNPAVKLTGHYQEMYGSEAPSPKIFKTTKAESDSETLRTGKGLQLVADGVLERYARDWRDRWASA